MKKTIKKVVALSLTALTLGVSTACNPFETLGPDEGEKINTDMSQLYLSNYNGGYGTEWLNEVKARFEDVYKEYSFEKDKKGVQVIIRSDKTGYSGQGLYDSMAGNRNDVFFSEAINYYDYVNAGYMLDISDVVNDIEEQYNKLDENKDGKTILSKMTGEQIDYLTTSENKVYALPHYVGVNGITYDIDLFNTKQLYYAKNGVASEDYALDKDTYGGYSGKVAYTNLAGKKSAGPDGKHGTYDDGLPATYEEFFALCKYMASAAKGIQPFTMTGQYNDGYTSTLLSALTANYEGVEQTMLNYTFSGEAKNLAKVVDGNIVKDAQSTFITNKNGYELARQMGKYYALEFIEGIVSYFDNKSWADEDSHVAAQTRYLRSSYLGQPIAFLVEGNWWENEASATFKELAKADESYSKMNRKLGFMPLPKATNDEIGKGSTLIDNLFGFAFINGDIEESKIELAKTFLKFCYTDYSLVKYTTSTGTLKAMDYELDDTAYGQLSTFGKSVWDLYHDENTRVVYQYSKNPLYLNNQSTFKMHELFKTTSGAGVFTSLVKNGIKAESYFAGMNAYLSQTKWASAYAPYFDN